MDKIGSRIVSVGGNIDGVATQEIPIGGDSPLVIIAGPCVYEPENTMRIAEKIAQVSGETGIPMIFKNSWDKANRTRLGNYRGVGMEEAIECYGRIRAELGLPVLTDIHEVEQAKIFGDKVDVLQVPAYLCRQENLLVAAAQNGKAVNIKKGQFAAPWEAERMINNIRVSGNNNVMITERGFKGGYEGLVVDFRSFPAMSNYGAPVVFDATHSIAYESRPELEKPMIEPIARAAVATGYVDAVFIETHDKMESALCDAKWMLPFERFKPLVLELKELHEVARRQRAEREARGQERY